MARILVIDDEELIRETIRMKLELSGHVVIEAANGVEGLRALDDGLFDLVVTDIIMPEQEGIETIRKIRHRDPQVAIIAISGGGRGRNYQFLDIAKKLGANEALSKPFTGSQLLALVETTLRGVAKP
jgi:DNA-binding response OmpR family regulator